MNNDIMVSQSDNRIQTISESEEIIREKAPAALANLQALNGMDLVDILGLTPYLESRNNV